MKPTASLWESIDRLLPEYEAFWEDICRIETPSENKEALDRQTAFIRRFCEKRGLPVREHPFPRAGNCLTVTEEDKQPRFALLAHLDTVHAVGSFGEEVVRRDGDLILGPGVVDCKGGAVEALLVFEALRQQPGAPEVKVILTTDEEVSARFSGPEGVAFIQEQARGVKAAFNCEVGRQNNGLTVSRKGVLRLRLTADGKAAHAGNRYFEGVNAIKAIALLIPQIESMSREGGTTYNCGVIQGGTKANIVAERCTLEIDIRAWTREDLDQAERNVRELAAVPPLAGSRITVEKVSCRPPMEKLPATMALFEKVSLAVRETLEEEVCPIEVGGGSDSAYLTAVGIPTLCSMGPVGGKEHTREEWVSVSSLKDRARLLCTAIYAAEDEKTL